MATKVKPDITANGTNRISTPDVPSSCLGPERWCLFSRLYRVAADPNNYDMSTDYFVGKSILDAGCGKIGYFQKAMFDLGANHVTCLDTGEEWISELVSALDSLNIPESFYTVISGDLTSLPFPPGAFDFVASHDALAHIEGKEKAERAVTEFGRVTKSGGFLFAYVGVSKPGIVDKYIVPSLRRAYREHIEFKEFIDTLTPATLKDNLYRYADIAKLKDVSIDGNALIGLIDLFTPDTCIFLQNMLQLPIQQGIALGLEWGIGQYESCGFKNIRRMPNTYWMRDDIRKYLSPIHFDTCNPITMLLYGGGHVKLVGEKI